MSSGYQEPVGGTSSPSTGTSVGSKPIRAILRMLKDEDVSIEAAYGSTFIPKVKTPWRFKSDAFRLDNPARTFYSTFESEALTVNQKIKIPQITTVESSERKDELVFLKQTQEIKNKGIDINPASADENIIYDDDADASHIAAFDVNGKLTKAVATALQRLPAGNMLMDVWKDSVDGLWKARNTHTGTIISSNADATTVIQAALNGLTTGRTWQEGIKIHSPGANVTVDIWQIIIPSYTWIDYSECRLRTVRPAGMVDDGPTNPNAYDGVSILTNTAAWDATDMSAVPAVSNITIVCGKADGNRFNLGNDQPAAQNKNFFYFVNADKVNIIEPWVIRAQHDGIRLKNCTNCVIYNPYVEDCRSEGISFRDGSDNTIINGRYLDTGWSFFTALNCQRSHFIGGYGYKNVAGSVSSSVNISSKQCVVDGFKMTNITGGGISFGDNDGSNSSLYDPDESVAMNCTIDTVGTSAFTILSWRSRGLKIVNNTMKNCGARGIAMGGFNERFVFTGNIISDCQQNGIYVVASTALDGGGLAKIISRGVISGNIIRNCGKDTGGAAHLRSGILLYGTEVDSMTDIIVNNNHCYDDQGTKTQNYGVYIQNTKDCAVYQNNCNGNLTDGLFLTGTNNNLTRYNNRGHAADLTPGFLTQANSWSATQTFRDNLIRIFNPGLNFPYMFRTSAITATRDVLLPLLTANDEFVFKDHPVTLAGKTLTNPTINAATLNGTITIPITTGTSGADPLIISKATGDGQDSILRIKMDDDANSYLEIQNATGTAGSFVPSFLCKNGTNATAGLFVGQGTTDTGANPLFLIRARIGGGTAVAVRPLFAVSNLNTAGNVTTWNVTNLAFLDDYNIKFGTTTGTKIGTTTTEKIGFWNTAPAVQPAAVADATDAPTVITQLNALLSRLRTIGIIAT